MYYGGHTGGPGVAEGVVVDPKIGDRVRLDDRVGTVVSVHRESDTGLDFRSTSWLVVEIEGHGADPRILVWVDEQRWPEIEVLDQLF